MVALNFKAQFADAVASGRKTQSIRQSPRVKAGDKLQLYTGQRTKGCRKLADAICIDCTYVSLRPEYVTLGDASKFPPDQDDFAKADGFDNYDAMYKWFKETYNQYCFIGYIIRWKLNG